MSTARVPFQTSVLRKCDDCQIREYEGFNSVLDLIAIASIMHSFQQVCGYLECKNVEDVGEGCSKMLPFLRVPIIGAKACKGRGFSKEDMPV